MFFCFEILGISFIENLECQIYSWEKYIWVLGPPTEYLIWAEILYHALARRMMNVKPSNIAMGKFILESRDCWSSCSAVSGLTLESIENPLCQYL